MALLVHSLHISYFKILHYFLIIQCLLWGIVFAEERPTSHTIASELVQDAILGTVTIDMDKEWYIYAPFSEGCAHPSITTTAGNLRIEWPLTTEEKNINTLTGEIKCKVYKERIEIPFAISLPKKNLESLEIKIEYYACDGTSCIKETALQNIDITSHVVSIDNSWIFMILIAFIGGVIINIMPCVLPVLGLKFYSLVSIGRSNPKQMRKQIIAMICGMYLVFIILALAVIILQASGQKLFWGMHFQSPLFISIMFIVFILITCNTFGFYKVTFHNGWLNSLINLQTMEHFFYGITATILATPCLAPFLATAIIFALNNSPIMVMSIYLSMAFGLSLPLWILFLYPYSMQWLPKPGKWMNILKFIIGILMLIVALWLAKMLWAIAGLWILLLCILIAILIMGHISKYLVILAIIAVLFMNWRVHEYKHNVPDTWQSWNKLAMQQYIDNDQLLIVVIGAEWCMTCKWNIGMALNQQSILQFLADHKVQKLYADYTIYDQSINELLNQYGQIGVPTTIIFGPSKKDGIVLDTVLSEVTIKQGILLAKKEGLQNKGE